MMTLPRTGLSRAQFAGVAALLALRGAVTIVRAKIEVGWQVFLVSAPRILRAQFWSRSRVWSVGIDSDFRTRGNLPSRSRMLLFMVAALTSSTHPGSVTLRQ